MRNFHRLQPLSAAVLAALLAACTVGPDHVRPDLDIGAAFARADEASTPTPGAVLPDDAEYWQSFDDPQLTRLIEDSLRANHDVRIVLSRLDAATALQRGVKLDRLPTLTASAGASESHLSADQMAGVDRSERTVRSHEASANLGWELDLLGRVRRNIEAKDADGDALSADLQALQVSLVAEVATEYVNLRGFQQRLQVTRQQAESQRETLRLVDSGLAAGRGTEFDQSRARAQLETTNAGIPALEAQVAFAQHRLAVLSGKPPAALVGELDRPRQLPRLPVALDPGTPGDLLRRRPDVAAAEARLRGATARVGVATADLFPRFTLGALLGSQAGVAGSLFGGDSESRFVALGVDWSFLDIGRVRARIAASNATAAGELARYEQTVLQALEETENALVRYGKARVQDQHLQLAAADSAHAAKLARTRYEAGVGTLLDVLIAERSDLQAQDALAQGRTQSLTGVISLYRAMGGGWPTRLPLRRELAQRPGGT